MATKRLPFVRRVQIALGIVLVVLALAVVAVVASATLSKGQPGPSVSNADKAALESLAVRDFDPYAPAYDRALFGQKWSDDVNVEGGHNGCDTRNDILARDLDNVRFRPNTRDCVVERGTLVDPYSGATIGFQRGQGTSELVQIDHIVPLADAWYAGASTWGDERRRDFANDPRNLLATSKDANQSKKAQTIDAWQPSNEAFRCEYARRIVAVKTSYGLGIMENERQSLYAALATCL